MSAAAAPSHFDVAEAVKRCRVSNAETMRFVVERARQSGFIDTKVNALTGQDYTDADGLRGPAYTYGWIQGRGLEALATHAAHFETHDPALAAQIDAVGARLYRALSQLWQRDEHIYFCYDAKMRPVRPDGAGPVAQSRPADIWTYSDAFAAKGLVAGAHRYAPNDLPARVAYLDRVVEAVAEDRFQMDERASLSETALIDQADDFGPRMILLGATGLLHRLGLGEHAGFSRAFVDHVLDRHFDPASGLLLNVPGENACNIGHAVELVGFALDDPTLAADAALVERLIDLLTSSFGAGFVGPGIALSVSAKNGAVLNAHCPWWPLPETVRAAALAHALAGSQETLDIWASADRAFFEHYWQPGTGYAFQTRLPEGPVDFVPATPDLDPGYHTGLSLLAAIESVEPQSKATSRMAAHVCR